MKLIFPKLEFENEIRLGISKLSRTLLSILSFVDFRYQESSPLLIPVKKQEQKEYSWCEIVKHDKPGDCWIVIGGLIYDLSKFVDKHPGGPMIYDGAGGDCTAPWHSYHPISMTKNPPPSKFCIGSVRDYVSFYSYDGKFYEQVKQEVEKILPRSKWQSHWKIYSKAIILAPLYFLSVYCYVVYCNVLSAIILGLVASQVGVNIMHDGNHAAFSQNKTISLIAGYALDFTFSTSVVYRRSHNFGHHGCVNHYELDRSFDTTFPLMRLHPLQPRYPYHRYQQYYIWLVYGLANFGDLFGTFDEMYWMSNYPTRRGHLTGTQVMLQSLVKFTWLIISMILPTYIHGWFNIFPVWFLYMMMHSWGYTLFFAVNHWTVEAGIVDNTNINEVNWGALQVINSSNFDTKSTFWTHLVGGLNYQIEHHLFPQITHTRLPEIQSIVKKIAKEHKLRYFEFKSFWEAIKSHYQLLKILGQQDDFPRIYE